MAFHAIDPSQTKDHVSPNDPDPDNPTVWKIGPIDALTWAGIQDLLASNIPSDGDGSTTSIPVGTASLEMVRHGLKGVENFQGAEFKTKALNRHGREILVVADEFLMSIPGPIVSELMVEIEKLNRLSPDQAKN